MWVSVSRIRKSVTKKAARTEKRWILTILRKHRGLFTVYYATKENPKRKRHPSIVQPTTHLPLSTGMKILLFSNLEFENVLRVQLAFESVR